MNSQQQTIKFSVPENIASSTSSIKKDAMRSPLILPFSGPYHMLSCTDKHFTLDLNDFRETISLDRLK